ncbi:MAG: HDOD domain-containing protein [Granulosicoccus sp.]
MTTVLFVNDEQSEINALRKWFSDRYGLWQMHFLTDVREALQLTEAETVDCLVCDMNLPAQAGQNLLVQLAEKRSNTVRIAHSTDLIEELRLENLHAIHRFVNKSDGKQALDDAITKSLSLHTELASLELQALIAGITSLPVLPEIYDKLMQELVSDDFSMQAICDIVEADMSLAATLLRIVNSPYLGMVQHIESASHAAQLLGVESIKNILLSENVINQFRQLGADNENINDLNAQSNIRGVLASRFARLAQLDKRKIDHSQIAGMLSSLGELIVESGMVKVSGFSANHRHDDLIGSGVLELWAMPDSIVEATLEQRSKQIPEGTASPVVILHSIRKLQQLAGEQNSAANDTEELVNALAEYAIGNSLARKWVDCFEDYNIDLERSREA